MIGSDSPASMKRSISIFARSRRTREASLKVSYKDRTVESAALMLGSTGSALISSIDLSASTCASNDSADLCHGERFQIRGSALL